MSAALVSSFGARRGTRPPVRPRARPAQADVVVVGGGVIGLSAAWALAESGRSVTVLERGRVGDGASLAATGMLAPAAEHEPGSDLLLSLALDSLARWPAFRDRLQAASGHDIDYRTGDRLQAASGHDIDYRTGGTLVLAVGRDEVERLRFRHDLQRRAGVSAAWLPGSEVRAREPLLRPAVTAGIHCPDDAQVDPARTMEALVRACEGAGVAIVEGCAVEGLERRGGRVVGLRADGNRIEAETVVLAAGAWSGAGGLLPEGVLPVRPVRGQALALRTTARTGSLAHMIWTEQIHMAPKGDGTLVVGATVEEIGFQAGVTAGGLFALLEGARRVLPGIEEMAVEAVWSGFRPTSDDDAPVLDRLDDGLVLAAGHHRNGYLLAPATAAAVRALANGEAAPPYARAFGLARFAAPGRAVA